MKTIMTAVAACMLAFGLAGACDAQQVLKVGSTTSGQPTSGINPQTKRWEGVAVEVLMAVAKDAGLQLEFTPMPFADLQPALLGKRIDIIASGYGVTPAREKVVDFTQPYGSFRDLLVVPVTDMKLYRSPADFKDMSIAIPKGSAYVDGLERAGAKLTLVTSPPQAISELEAGHVAGVVDNGLQVAYRLRGNTHPELKIVDSYSPIQEVKLAFAVQKGNADLLAKLNASLTKLQADGTVKSIASKWGLK
jgi:polar amino acid transport system substrate-binding protein